MGLNQVLKIAWVFRQFALDFIEGCLKGQQLEWVFIMEPGGQHAQHQSEPNRESASVVLTQPEFDRVHGGGHRTRINSLADQRVQGIQNKLFDLLCMTLARPLQARRKYKLV